MLPCDGGILLLHHRLMIVTRGGQISNAATCTLARSSKIGVSNGVVVGRTPMAHLHLPPIYFWGLGEICASERERARRRREGEREREGFTEV